MLSSLPELFGVPGQFFLFGFGCGLLSGVLLFRKNSPSKQDATNGDDENSSKFKVRLQDDCKMVLVVRTDLKMGKGKAAAQCAHAAVSAVKKCEKRYLNILHGWQRNGQPKIVLKIDSEKEMLELGDEAQGRGLIVSVISDAGRTQVMPGSKTVMAVGPGRAVDVDAVTGHLKLF